jgi:aryl carrier-like protein
LLEHPDVVQAVTFAVPHATIGEDVAAAVVLRGGAAVSESGLRNWLFDRLTPAKVPSRIVVVAAIPKGATGKVQRVGLHQKLAEALHAEHVPPRTPTEAQLAALWAELLQVDRVGITDNFFSLGGDSLRGARVISRLNQRGVVTFSVRDLFRTPTIEHLAAHIDAAEADRNAALLAFVESLSPEEVERMLETRGGNPLA